MTWFRVKDSMWGHPKFQFVSNDAIALWVSAGSWSMCYLTDGLVPPHALTILRGSKQAAQELVDAGIWDVTPDGYLFHEWNEYNYTKSQVEDFKKKERDKKRRQRAAKTDVSDVSPRDTDGTPSGSPYISFSLVSSSSKELETSSASVTTSQNRFDEFWASFRKSSPKSDKTPARRSYEKSMKVISHDDLMAAAAAQVREWDQEGKEPQFRAHWTTWLNQRRWERFAEAVEQEKPREVDPSARCEMCEVWIKGKPSHVCVGGVVVEHEVAS